MEQLIYSKYLDLLATRYFHKNEKVVVDDWINVLKGLSPVSNNKIFTSLKNISL